MTKKKAILTALVFLVIGGLYYYFYGDALKKPVIHLSHTLRPSGVRRTRAGRPAETRMLPTFALNGEYQLTSVRVIAVDDLKTNQSPHPLWELNSDTKSVPVRALIYGITVRGMKTSVPGAQPETLASNVAYRLYVEAGRVKGQHDFTIPGEEQPVQPPQ